MTPTRRTEKEVKKNHFVFWTALSKRKLGWLNKLQGDPDGTKGMEK